MERQNNFVFGVKEDDVFENGFTSKTVVLNKTSVQSHVVQYYSLTGQPLMC